MNLVRHVRKGGGQAASVWAEQPSGRDAHRHSILLALARAVLRSSWCHLEYKFEITRLHGIAARAGLCPVAYSEVKTRK
ncbi:hypothetical protein E2C01_045297 [Portunus trituberculatus]|uniref:Uncharacterized protein n=1 Tax=Portunus trituberculatus TaxID=210409 RepID=A0A5B7FVD7_PORTR|nr:hypothetical protein [Portunus trituberculatus]